jgi:hypothetical protein
LTLAVGRLGTACGNIALIVDYAGTPTTYGQIIKTHLAAR